MTAAGGLPAVNTVCTGVGFGRHPYDGLDFGDPSPWQVVVGDFDGNGKASYARLGGDKAFVFAAP